MSLEKTVSLECWDKVLKTSQVRMREEILEGVKLDFFIEILPWRRRKNIEWEEEIRIK